MGAERAETGRARVVYMKWKTLFRPSGCIVPSLKMISISNCFRLTLTPVHFRKPLTAMLDRLCPGELKCSATGKPLVFFWTLRRCSPNRSRRVRPVSPIYSGGHRRHEMQHTTFSDLQVKCSRMMVEQASAAAGMSTCESSWYLCLGPVGGVYQDVFQAAIASMCNYRWSWEDCCSRRVSRQDVKVVKQNVLNTRTQGVVGQHQRNPFFVVTDTFRKCFLAGNGGHPLPSVLQ
jgi:hypothetical protein